MAALESDFQKYFEVVKPGQKVDVPGGGTVTRNEDGTATFSNGAYQYTYGANTSVNDVAANVPALAAQWAKQYGTPQAQTPFSNLDEFKAWEAKNIATPNAHFAQGYQAPDYVKMMGLTIQGGNDDAFKRYLFFKNNPQYAQDYANIHAGQQSKFATDGSSLQRTNTATLSQAAQDYYKNNPNTLRAAEAFNLDPELHARRFMGQLPQSVNYDYMQKNAMDAEGNTTASNNVLKALNWRSPLYVQNEYDLETGGLIDNGTIYDAVTGQPFGTSNQDRLAAELSQQGVGGDTTIAHLTPGEVVVPREVVQANPQLKSLIDQQAQRMGIDTSRTTVGAGNVINPKTGLPMFATQAEEDAYNAWIQTPGAKEYQAWVSGSSGGAASPSASAPSSTAPSSGTPVLADAGDTYTQYNGYGNDRNTYGNTHSTTGGQTSGTTLTTSNPVFTGGSSTTGSTSGTLGSTTTATTGATGNTIDYSSQISNIFRNTFGRDPNQAGLDYWNQQAQKYGGVDKIYNYMVGAGQANKEQVKQLDFNTASGNYAGPMGGETSNSTVDEWFYNVLGRAPTDQERSTYQPALEYRLKTGGVDMANTIYTMFLRNNNVDPGTAMSMAQASQLYGGNKKPVTPGTNGNGMPTTGIGLDQVQGPTKWDIDAQQTVAGQLQQVLANDSPLMQQARARAMQQMSGRGLVNSSMAQTAADSAMYDQAMQIAQSDASTYAKRGQYNADTSNTFSRDNNAFVRDAFMADFNLAANDWAAQQDFDRQYKMLDRQQQLQLERDAVQNGYQTARDKYLNDWSVSAAQQDRDLQLKLTGMNNAASNSMDKVNTQINANKQEQALNALNNARSNFASQMISIATSQLSGDAKDKAISDLVESTNAIIRGTATQFGWDASSWLIKVDKPATTPATTPTTTTGTGAPTATTPGGSDNFA